MVRNLKKKEIIIAGDQNTKVKQNQFLKKLSFAKLSEHINIIMLKKRINYC